MALPGWYLVGEADRATIAHSEASRRRPWGSSETLQRLRSDAGNGEPGRAAWPANLQGDRPSAAARLPRIPPESFSPASPLTALSKRSSIASPSNRQASKEAKHQEQRPEA